VISGRDDMPVNFVSFFDALRFVNWLDNGQPTGAQDASTTEDGAYTFSGPTTVSARNEDATIALPSENEWYKAAYYDAQSASYFDYPASSNAPTTCSMPTATPNQANCGFVVSDVTIKGSYTGSPSPYDTFDQGGNVLEWTEAIIGVTMNRGLRGGYFGSSEGALAASIRGQGGPSTETESIGFRVAPEPDRNLLLVAGVLGLFGLAGLRRARA
jgi:formylglycine-generating enzyme required for sulfatase activity